MHLPTPDFTTCRTCCSKPPTKKKNMATTSIKDFRIVVAENRTNVWEIYVRLLVTTQPRNDNIDDDQGQHLSLATQVVDSFEKVEETDSCSMDRCAICLEEFYEGSKSELVKTLCSHVFHKECVVKWVQNCICSQSSCSCPLCRCPIA